MNKLSLVVKTIFFLLAIFISSHSSAIMRGMSTEELTIESDVVVQGEVKNVKAHWSRDGKTIITRAIILRQHSIKGVLGRRNIVVEYDGGEIGDIGLRVSDIAPLKEGEQVILFLQSGISKIDGEVFHIVGKGQGKYVIGNDGIARKSGFSVIDGQELIDNNIPVDNLIEKIQKIK
jgi:hypothetical protein